MGDAGAVNSRTARLRFDIDNRIVDELICGGCGYNLRGRTLDEKCPECGMDVSRSVRDDLLRYANPAWLKSIANGLLPLMACAALALLYKIAYAVALNRYVIPATTPGQSNSRFNILVWSSFASTLVLQALTLAGVWLVTRREPDAIQHEPRWIRPVARTAMVVSAGLWMLGWMPWLMYAGFGRSFYPNMVLYGAQITAGVISSIGSIALFVLARRLALRVPDEALARRTVIAAIAMLMIMTIDGVYSWSDVFGFFMTISGEASRCLVHLPQTIVTVWAIVLLMQYRARIRNVIASRT